MQGKGFVRVLAIAFAVGCLYSLSFNLIAYNVEKKADTFAHGNPNKRQHYLDSVSTEPVYPLFNFTYAEVKENCLNLGLDLKGGMNVTMEIELGELIKNLSGNNGDPALNKAIDVAQERLKNSQIDFITLFSTAYNELAPSGRLGVLFATRENAGTLSPTSTNEQVVAFLRREASSAFDRSFNILRTRIDKFGVSQPNIQKISGTNRILIELPGISEPERVRKLLQGSAKLEFWQTFDVQEAFPTMDAVNKVIAAKEALQDSAKSIHSPLEKLKKASSNALLSKLQNPALNDNKPNNDTVKGKTTSLLSRLKKDSLHQQTDSNSQAGLARRVPLFKVLAPPLYQDQQGKQQYIPGSVVGFSFKKDTAEVNKYLAETAVRAVIPSNMKFLWSVKAGKDNRFELYALKITNREGKAALEGDVIADASKDIDQQGNPEVRMVMNADGSNAWSKITEEASTDHRSVAIVLDDQVYSAPSVKDPITGGVSTISGSFTIKETEDLANVLKAGRLPAPAHIVEESIVGASLGKEAISAGLISSVVGLLVIMAFMWFYYNQAGSIADLTVITNVFFIIGVLASLRSVLTLPGIAGIVLTIATSVDANVLVYERIREELNLGKNIRNAVQEGFKKALPSILDSNIATFLLGIILLFFGTGPIKGFAVTLIIGIFTSLFAAVLITRLVFESRLDRGKGIKLDNKYTHNAFKNIHFDFLSRRVLFYGISGTIIAIGMISIFVRGFSLGVDFKGGRTYDIEFAQPVTASLIRSSLAGTLGSAPEVKTITGGNRVKATTTLLIDDNSDQAQKTILSRIQKGLNGLHNPYHILSQQKVGPTIANDIKTKAIYAILLGIAVVFAYILIRFEKWQFGVAAVVALAHDVLILLSLFSIFNGLLPFSLEIDQAFIASVLTVMGYSMLDTVVVFDRVREFLGKNLLGNQSMSTVINDALNSTLSRTLITSLTTLTVLLILFIFGGESLKGFTFAMLIGVIFGTYSSIFVATPVVVDLIRNKKAMPQNTPSSKKVPVQYS